MKPTPFQSLMRLMRDRGAEPTYLEGRGAPVVACPLPDGWPAPTDGPLPHGLEAVADDGGRRYAVCSYSAPLLVLEELADPRVDGDDAAAA
ncbi:MAG: hypothetical protein AAGK21_03935 [Bacteroidota bacterium]